MLHGRVCPSIWTNVLKSRVNLPAHGGPTIKEIVYAASRQFLIVMTKTILEIMPFFLSITRANFELDVTAVNGFAVSCYLL